MDERAAQLSDLEALGVLAEPTRRRLYECVAEAETPITREAAARTTGVDRSLAAYHLDKLAGHGLLEASYSRPPGRVGRGAGRPAKRYRRAAREFVSRTPPRDYRLLAELLVEAVDAGEVDLAASIERTARDVGRRLGAAAAGDGTEQTVQALLRSRGYEPVEAEPGVLRLRNCPFDGIAARHPDLVCGLNLALIKGILDAQEAEGTSAVLAPEAGACCVVIRTRKEGKENPS